MPTASERRETTDRARTLRVTRLDATGHTEVIAYPDDPTKLDILDQARAIVEEALERGTPVFGNLIGEQSERVTAFSTELDEYVVVVPLVGG
jgi:hypothetical protein